MLTLSLSRWELILYGPGKNVAISIRQNNSAKFPIHTDLFQRWRQRFKATWLTAAAPFFHSI